MSRPFWITIVVAGIGLALILAVLALSEPALVVARFSESGLPSGRSWSVTLASHTYTSSTSAIAVSLLASEYPFEVALTNGTDYTPIPAAGELDVLPTGAAVTIVFVRSQANVTITESGLPAGSWWAVAEGTTYHNSNTNTINLREPNGNHTLRTLVTLNGANPFWNGSTYVEDDYYAPNTSRIDLTVNGSDLQVAVQFVPLIQLNASLFPINLFANATGLGAPAYEFGAWTIHRFTALNFSFEGISLNGVIQNSTAYLMTQPEFEEYASTGVVGAFVWATGNVSYGSVNMTFASGTWFYVVTGWAVSEFHSVGLRWLFSFPGSLLYSS